MEEILKGLNAISYIQYDINKYLIYTADNHFHFIVVDLSGVIAINLIDDEIKQILNINTEIASNLFRQFMGM